MKSTLGRPFLAVIPVAVATILISCGSGASNRMLQSISISPVMADAQNGQKQFVATGTFSSAPVTVSPLPAFWTISGDASCTTMACPNISSDGLAKCVVGASTQTVHASAPADPKHAVNDFGVSRVTGAATLVCP